MTPYTPEEIARAHTLAYQAVPERSQMKSRAAAFRGALIAIRATTERAALFAVQSDGYSDVTGTRIARELLANHHLKDRPDAG